MIFYSHSIVAGGFPEMSYVTRDTPWTSLMMRRATRSRNSYGRRDQRAVMKSMVSTARKCDDIVVTASVAHHRDGAHGQENGECLAGAVVEIVVAQFFDEDRHRPCAAGRHIDVVTSPRMRTLRPGPGKGWR